MRHQQDLQRIRDGIEGNARSPRKLRDEVRALARAATLGGSSPDLAESLGTVVEKIARHAYKITDEDVAALAQDGYGEDEIYELTVVAAHAAAEARLEAAFAALSGEEAVA